MFPKKMTINQSGDILPRKSIKNNNAWSTGIVFRGLQGRCLTQRWKQREL